MKRRTADFGKLRRNKRNKIEGIYNTSNTLLYMKFLILWAIVITADFILEFRFEFLWPFWLLLRSVHDSFKYKGLAFSVLFVCIAITSDLVCLFFIPVNWLFFAASTYVWVQYVWHTDKGVCLPTIILWMLFVYLEAAVRWKDTSRHMPHLDLCRPFAAHCIGYPVVTLGFGFKSYVGYRMRQRKQRDVAKENEFYMQLLQQALPLEEAPDVSNVSTVGDQLVASVSTASDTATSKDMVISANNNNLNSSKNNAQSSSKQHSSSLNNSVGPVSASSTSGTTAATASQSLNLSNGCSKSINNKRNQSHVEKESTAATAIIAPTVAALNYLSNKLISSASENHQKLSSENTSTISSSASSTSSLSTTGRERPSKGGGGGHNHSDIVKSSASDYHTQNGNCGGESNSKFSKSTTAHSHQNGSLGNYEISEANDSFERDSSSNNLSSASTEKQSRNSRKNRIKHNKNNNTTTTTANDSVATKDNQHHEPIHISQHQQTTPLVCEGCARLESENKRVKSEISHLRQMESELKHKIDGSTNLKSCLLAKQKENDELEKKLNEISNSRQLDRQNLQIVERRLGDERRQRQSLESQLNNERKLRKLTEERAIRTECSDVCKMKKQQLEMECNKYRRDLAMIDDAKNLFEQQNRNYEQELLKMKNELRNREHQQGNEALMSALNRMQLLEKNLSDETRVKLDLFSALGEAKRQLEIRDNLLRNCDKEVLELKAKIAQLLAVMPCHESSSFNMGPTSNVGASMLRLNNTPPLLPVSQSQPNNPTTSSNSLSHQLCMSVSPLLGQLGKVRAIISTPPPQQQQQSQQQQSLSSTSTPSSLSAANNSAGSNSSSLDPNATAYTPKTNIVGGTEA